MIPGFYTQISDIFLKNVSLDDSKFSLTSIVGTTKLFRIGGGDYEKDFDLLHITCNPVRSAAVLDAGIGRGLLVLLAGAGSGWDGCGRRSFELE